MRRFQRSQQVEARGITPVDTGEMVTSLLGGLQRETEKSYVQAQVNEAEKAGELAGTNFDFRPVSGGGIAQKAFNETALQTNKQMLASDIMLKVPQLAQNAYEAHPNNSQTAFKQFEQTSNQYAANLLNEVPDENREYVQNMLNHHIGRANLSFGSRILQEKRIKAEGQFTISDTAFANSTNDAIHGINFNMPKEEVQKQVDAAQGILAQRIKGIRLAEEGGIISPKAAQKATDGAINGFRDNLYARHYEAALQDGKGEEFLENLQKSNIEGLDEFGKANLVAKLGKIGRTYVNARKNEHVFLQQSKKDYLNGLTDGADREVNFEQKYISANPEKAEEFNFQVQNAQFIGQQVESLKDGSFDQQNAALARMKPEKGETNFGLKMANFDAIQKKINVFNKQYNQDKVATLLSNPSVVNALNKKAADDRSGFDFSVLRNAGIKPNTDDPLARLVIAQTVKGTSLDNVSVVTNQQAHSAADLLTSNLRSGNIMGALDLFDQWKTKYGKFYPVFMRNLQSQGKLPVNATFIVGTSPNDPAVPQLESALITPTSQFKKALSDTQWQDYENQIKVGDSKFENLVSSFQNYNSASSAQYIASMRQFTNQLTLSYMANTGMSAEDAYGEAVKFIDNKFELTSIDGSIIRIPRRADKPYVEQDVVDFANNFKDNTLPKMDIRVPSGYSKKVYFDNFIKGGHWVTNPANNGLVYVDNNGNLVRLKNGNIVGFTYDQTQGFDINHPELKPAELQDARPTSELLKESPLEVLSGS